MHPNYANTDRRPLSARGPQTQRLGMVGVLNNVSGAYKLEPGLLCGDCQAGNSKQEILILTIPTILFWI
jgi:hypothetical protein